MSEQAGQYAVSALAVPPESDSATDSPARPGSLRGGATLTLQTRQAQRLVKGRGASAGKPAITGLFSFASLLSAIWQGARTDDPFADWWLLRIDAALSLAETNLASAQADIDLRLADATGMRVELPQSSQPLRIALNFSNPYAFRAARLIGRYDAHALVLLAARHVGLLGRDETEQALHRAGRHVRRALLSASGYRFHAVSRADVQARSARGLRAMAAMGEPPPDVIEGRCRAAMAPAMTSRAPAPATATMHALVVRA